jgi:hypothetical protein
MMELHLRIYIRIMYFIHIVCCITVDHMCSLRVCKLTTTNFSRNEVCGRKQFQNSPQITPIWSFYTEPFVDCSENELWNSDVIYFRI